MLLSFAWLREFVPYEGTAAELGDILTMSGLEVEGICRPYESLRPVVAGYVAECGRHPEADKLSVCRVDVGDEMLDIVCGAPNVAQGQKVAVIKVGSRLPSGQAIKKTRLRGVPSHGMICSESELGLSDNHDGILVLDADAPVGTSLMDALNLDDAILDVSVTPNRGDCLSVLGMAREVAALANLPLTLPESGLEESGENAMGALDLEVLTPELCHLYQGRIIENAVTGPAPARMRYRLQSVGIRAISNLVDVTNHILMELGQPLHAFDLDTIRGGRIRVRAADEGERFTTLDGQERILTSSDITIRDGEGIICLGGVMGGLDSEITEKSSRVFLEAAIFHPSHIRRTARRLGLHSEAAYRFERGVDQGGATYAVNRAAALMAKLSGGFVRPGLLRTEPLPWKSPVIQLRKTRAETLLGIPMDSGLCESILTRLGCAVTKKSATPVPVWDVVPPSHRRDLTREADLIEELIRVHGLDSIPAVLPGITHSLEGSATPESEHVFLSRVKHWGRGAGLHETVTYSFVSHRDLDQLGIPDDERIRIMNPLSDDMDTLRTRLTPGLLHSLRANLAQGAASVRIFETASTFSPDAASETTAREVPRLGILLNGARFEQGWPQPSGDCDYLDVKGLVENFLAAFSLTGCEFTLADAQTGQPWLTPCVHLNVNGRHIGHVGKLRPEIADTCHAKKAVWLAEIDLEAVRLPHEAASGRFTPLPVFPPVRRDITFLAGPTLMSGEIANVVRGLKLPLLSHIALIDYFEPRDRDEKNLTFRLTFRHAGRTLKDSEADKQRDIVIRAVQEALGVRV